MPKISSLGLKNKVTDTSKIATNEYTALNTSSQKAKNNGGIMGGVGYLGEKVALGFLSSVEGIWDYTAGGIAKFFGDDAWAEKQFATDWVNYGKADERFNPSSGWQVAGDVASGIGTSLPALAGTAAGTAIAYASGGTLTPFAAGLISGSIAGLGAAGNATKEAYYTTGELGGKEFGYGALSGATEAGVELLSAGISKGTGRIVSELAKTTAKETAETVAKTGVKQIAKHIAEDFAQEAFEEGLSEILSPVYKRMTYDKTAQNASLQEVAYAAMVGGLSGAVMSGTSIGINSAVNTTSNLISGNSAITNGTVESIMETGRKIAESEAKNNTGIEAFKSVRETYEQLAESLKTTSGTVNTVKQKMLLGKLKRANVIAKLHPNIEKSARGIVFNAENVVKKLSAYGMTDSKGKAFNFTAEEIMSGIDTDLATKAKSGNLSKSEADTLLKQIRKALTDNSVLATLAVAEATGEIMVDTRRIAETALSGENLANAGDLNRLIERGTPEELQALGQAFGIEDWSKVTIDEFKNKVTQFNENGGFSEFAEQSKRVRAAAEKGKESAKPLPHVLRKNMQDGVYRFSTDSNAVNMALFKDGDTYHIYDYDTRNISRAMTVQDVNRVIKRFWEGDYAATTQTYTQQTNLAQETLEIDKYALDNIPEYRSMNEPNKAAVRMTVRQARAHGLAEAETLTFAKVAAKSGLNIIFDSERAFGDGAISDNTIYINPNNSEARTYEVILAHEMFHKIFMEGDKRAFKLFKEAQKQLTVDKASDIELRYKKFYKKNGVSNTVANVISQEEIAAAGTEEVFKNADAWAYILSKDPSVAEKVLSFFRKSAREYSSIQGLSAQARKFLRRYKALFESLSAHNQGNNALSIALEGADMKMPVTNTETDSVHVTGDNDVEVFANAKVDTDARLALSKGKAERLKNDLVKLGTLGIRLDAGGKSIRILTDKFTQNKNIFSNKGRNMREVNARIKAIPHFAEILKSCTYDGTDAEIHGLENEAKKGVVAMHRFKGTYEGFDIEVVVRDKGAKQFLYEIKFIEKEKSPQQSMTDESAFPAPLGDAENKLIITHSDEKSNPSDEISSKNPDASFVFSETSANADARYALPETLKKLEEYDATRVRHIESSGKDRVVRDYDEIIEFIKRSKTNPPFERLHIGIISDKTATLVKARTGEDISGYDFVLSSNFVFHIYNSHGNETAEIPRGQKAVNDANIENIIETVIAPDDVSLVNDSNGTAFRFEKLLEGRNVAITITSTKKSTLTLKSAWIINEKSGGRTLSANANALAGTPEANSRSSTNNSITENTEKSNTSDKISSKNPAVRFALPETVEQEVLEKYGRTFSWSTAGYIFKNGTKLDLSGKSVGAPGGYRALDHRDIFDIYEVDSYTDAMIEFMARGNIRVAPELPGINLIVEPTGAQYEQITSLIERLGWKEKEFHVDFDNGNGSTIDCLDYYGNVSARKIISDIKYFFKEGKTPHQSDLAQFRYALHDDTHADTIESEAHTENFEKSIEKYTKNQYNSFGWARAAEALSKAELDDLYSKIQSRSTLRSFKQSANGEAIVEVNNKPHTTLDTDNVFVFIKGNKNDFTVSRVVRFNVASETDMEAIRGGLYEGRTWSDSYCSFLSEEGFAKEYRRENSQLFTQYQQEVRRELGGQESRRVDADYRRRKEYRSGYSLTVGENGEIVEQSALKADGGIYTSNNAKQYNSFGWARAAEALSKAELDDLYSKIQSRVTLRSFKQSANGEAIVEVNNKPHTTLDTDNVFVFIKGNKNDFTVSRVVRFNVASETEMENIKGGLYERGKSGSTYLESLKKEGIAREYRREDFSTFDAYSERRSNGETSGRTDTHHRRSEKYRSGYSLTVGENGEVVEQSALKANGGIYTSNNAKQYNSFGWARAAEALSKAELDDLYSKIQSRSTLRSFKQSANGEAIVEVNNKPHTTLDTDNVFVFIKGNKNDFTVSRVVRFDVATETEMNSIRRNLYEGRTCSDSYIGFYQKEGLAREYRVEDYPTFDAYSERRSNGETSGRTDTHHRRSEKYRSGYSLTVGENGEVVEQSALKADGGIYTSNDAKQYNSFGWARAAEALSKTELDDLYSKIQSRVTLRSFKQSTNGEAVVEVNSKPYTTLDTDNVFVFVKGKKDDFDITRVVRFNIKNETEMSIIKEDLYEGRTCSDTHIALYSEEGIAREYRRENFSTFNEYREGRSNGEESGRTDTHHRRSEKYRSGYSLTVGEDGEIVERYALRDDGDVITGKDVAEMYKKYSEMLEKNGFSPDKIMVRGIPRKSGTVTLTVGELKKRIAQNTHDIVFSKKMRLKQ